MMEIIREIIEMRVHYEIDNMSNISTNFGPLRIITEERRCDYEIENWAEFIDISRPVEMELKCIPLTALQSRIVINDMYQRNQTNYKDFQADDVHLSNKFARLGIAFLNYLRSEENPKLFIAYSQKIEEEIEGIGNILCYRFIRNINPNIIINKNFTCLVLPRKNWNNPGEINVPLLVQIRVSCASIEHFIRHKFENLTILEYYFKTTIPADNTLFKQIKKLDESLPCTVYKIVGNFAKRCHLPCVEDDNQPLDLSANGICI